MLLTSVLKKHVALKLFCWFKQLKNAFCFKEQHKMEKQSGSAVAVCTDDLNLWAEIAVSSLNRKSCHKNQALPPFPLLRQDAPRSAASEGDSCYCIGASLHFSWRWGTKQSSSGTVCDHCMVIAQGYGAEPVTGATVHWVSPSASSSTTSHAQRFRDTAFHTSVNLTLISKAEIKIVATKTRFLTKELGSWAYIQSKNSESSWN